MYYTTLIFFLNFPKNTLTPQKHTYDAFLKVENSFPEPFGVKIRYFSFDATELSRGFKDTLYLYIKNFF